MWGLVLIVLSAVIAGLYWAFHNFNQIKKINTNSHFSVDEELSEMQTYTSLGVVEIGGIIHEGASAFIWA